MKFPSLDLKSKIFLIDYTRIELPGRICSRLKWKSCSIWNGSPDALRRAISVDPFSKQFEIVFHARCIYRVCVPSCICLCPICYRRHCGTLFDSDLYENKGTFPAFGDRKLNPNAAVKRFRREEYFLLCLSSEPTTTTFYNYLSQRQSNVLHNKFHVAFAFTLKPVSYKPAVAT